MSGGPNIATPILSTAPAVGTIFQSLVRELAGRLEADVVSVGELLPAHTGQAETLALFSDGAFRPNMIYTLAGTPCERILSVGLCVYPDAVDTLFPEDPWLRNNGIRGYLGVPLHDAHGIVIGLLNAMFRRPVTREASLQQILHDFAARACVELERARRERDLARSHRDLALLQDLVDRLHRSLNRSRLGHQTLSTVIHHGLAAAALWHTFDPNRDEVILDAWRGVQDHRAGAHGEIGTLSQYALRGGWRLPFSLDELPDHEGTALRRIQALGFEESVVIPLGFMGRHLGALELLYLTRRDRDRLDLDTLAAVGRTLSLALVNADQFTEMEYHALHDPLTGLANRTRFHRDAKQFLERVPDGQAYALMLLDIRRFGEINKTLGHHTGDLLLREMAVRLRRALDDRSLLSRLSGDEFAVLLPVPVSVGRGHDWSQELCHRLTSTVNGAFHVGGIALEIRCSLGIALAPEHAMDSHALLRCADVALQRAKQVPGEPVLVYQRDFDEQNPLRLALLTDLTTAIRDNQLFLHFQPKVRLDDGALSGFEALVRWRHPELGLVAPGQFIPLVEVSDLIRPLTYWVLENALEQIRGWRRSGLDVPVAVNLSPSLLLDQSLPEYLAALLRRHDVPARLLELEITEGALLADPDKALAIAHRLSGLGVRLSVDDFGTGYSSLAYLKRLPLTALKIDQSFVQEMLDSEHDRIIVRSTIGLAHSLGLKVVAEGVETQASFHALRDMGCDEGQGYCIARPESPVAVQRRLLARVRPVGEGPVQEDRPADHSV